VGQRLLSVQKSLSSRAIRELTETVLQGSEFGNDVFH
jgi:hypothetical protein